MTRAGRVFIGLIRDDEEAKSLTPFRNADGNLNCVTTHATCDGNASRNQSWTSFNMASAVVQGGTTVSFTYDPSHARASETESGGGTITNFANYPEIGVMAERVQTGTKFNWRNYIMADGQMVAIRTAPSGQYPMMFYPILDNLGSMAALVDGNVLTPQGQLNTNYTLAITRYSYDAFGMARDPNNWTPLDCTKGPRPPFVRGFTGQEHLPDNVCLINLGVGGMAPKAGGTPAVPGD
jgi:YD repeat-containing protein